jgi:ATP-binding cassette subfamily B protein/subfamily B ATP-binding cassette protein MsbA
MIQETSEYSLREFVGDIWRFVQPYKWKFFFASILLAGGNALKLYKPYALSLLVTFFATFSREQSLVPVYIIFGILFLAIIFQQAGVYFGKMMMYALAEKIALEAQNEAMQHLMMIDMAWHEKENAGSKFKRIERGSESFNKILRLWSASIIGIGINLTGSLLIIFHFDKWLSLSLLVFLVSYYALSSFYRKKTIEAVDGVNKKEEKRSGLLFEYINNIRSVKTLSMMETVMGTMIDNAAALLQTIKIRVYRVQLSNSVRYLYGNLAQFCFMIFVIFGVVQGKYQIGFLVLFVTYFSRVWESISEFTDVAEEIAIAKNTAGRRKKILDIPVIIDEEEGKVPFPQDWKMLSLRDVSFSYDEKPVLSCLSFEVQRGSKVGIVGLSGSGKSTLFKLLLKEHESYSGEIFFDDINLKSISKKDYLRYIAVVLQETELFDCSLQENVTITNYQKRKNKALFEQALDIAFVREFANKLPKKIKTLLGEKGVKLSGGEKQRVGIARAVFKQPQLLLLDEATSHLDIESEEKIQKSLHTFFASVTAVVIAHRLTTIKEMDTIIVIEEGCVLETGSFAELQALRGRFFALWEKQSL